MRLQCWTLRAYRRTRVALSMLQDAIRNPAKIENCVVQHSFRGRKVIRESLREAGGCKEICARVRIMPRATPWGEYMATRDATTFRSAVHIRDPAVIQCNKLALHCGSRMRRNIVAMPLPACCSIGLTLLYFVRREERNALLFFHYIYNRSYMNLKPALHFLPPPRWILQRSYRNLPAKPHRRVRFIKIFAQQCIHTGLSTMRDTSDCRERSVTKTANKELYL